MNTALLILRHNLMDNDFIQDTFKKIPECLKLCSLDSLTLLQYQQNMSILIYATIWITWNKFILELVID